MKNLILAFSVISYLVLVIVFSQCDNSENRVRPLTNSWEIAVPNQEVPEGLTSLSAEQCGACHQQHYEEWKLSTHAHAWVDLQFQAELKKESSPFMCINCHIPLQNQQEFIVTGLIDGDIYKPVKEKNPRFDKNLQQEGINCASCHVRDGAVIGTTGTTKAPHKTVKNPAHLSEKLCISCHNAVAVITPTLACTFQTGDEWKAGPYFDKKNCISCHMEPLQREIVPGFGERLSHLHYFAGSGIPKFDTVRTIMLNGYTFYPSELKKSYAVGDSIKFEFKVKNENAGHNVPTGDPERYFLFVFEITNENDSIVSTKTERIGETWEWHPIAKKIADNNMEPMEERTFKFNYPTEKAENLTLSVRVEKHRLNQESANYNQLGDHYPLYVTIFDENYAIEIKVLYDL